MMLASCLMLAMNKTMEQLFYKICWSRGISETYGFTLVRSDFLRNPRIRFFGRKLKIGPCLAKNGPKLSIFGQNSPKSLFFAHIFKIIYF